ANRREDVRQTLSEMRQKGLKPDVVCYTSLLKLYFNAPGFLEESEQKELIDIFQEMRKEKIRPNAHLYREIISFFGRKGQLDMAIRQFEEMKIFGIPRNPFVYEAVMESVAHSGKLELAFRFLEDMKNEQIMPS